MNTFWVSEQVLQHFLLRCLRLLKALHEFSFSRCWYSTFAHVGKRFPVLGLIICQALLDMKTWKKIELTEITKAQILQKTCVGEQDGLKPNIVKHLLFVVRCSHGRLRVVSNFGDFDSRVSKIHAREIARRRAQRAEHYLLAIYSHGFSLRFKCWKTSSYPPFFTTIHEYFRTPSKFIQNFTKVIKDLEEYRN